MDDRKSTYADLLEENKKLRLQVSSLKQKEKFNNNEDRFRSLVETTSDWIWEVDQNGIYTYVSPKIKDILGYEPEEIIGKTPFDLMETKEAKRVGAIFEDAVKKKKALVAIENTNIHKDKRLIILETSAVPILDIEGNIKGYRGIDRDITKRKQAEDALRESEELFGISINQIDGILWVADTKLRITISKGRKLSVFGLRPDELVGKTIFDFYQTDDKKHPMVAAHHRALLGETMELETIHEGVMFSSFVSPMKNASGKITGVVGLAIDITKQKKAEKLVHDQAETIASIVDTSQDWIWTINLQGIHTYSNHAIEKILGYPVNTFVGSPSFDLMHEDDRKTIEQEFQNWIAKKKGWQGLVIRWKHKSGSWRYLESNAVPIIDEDGEITGFRGVDRDITKHVEMENALRESEAFTKTVMDHLPIGLAVNTVNPVVDFNYMNDNFPRFYRTTREKLADPDMFWDAVYEDPEFREKIKKQVLDDTASGDQERMYWADVPISRKGEETTYVTARNIPVPGKELMISTVWDVTERKTTEEKIKAKNDEYLAINEELNESLERIQKINTELEKAKEKAEESDRLKSAFLANMSHEIRTPMNGILGFSDLLKTEQLTSEKQQEYIEVIEKSGERMLSTINDLIDISKIEANQMEVSVSQTNVDEEIEYLYAFFRPEVEQKGIKFLSKREHPAEDVIIETDKEKLSAILSNLIKNAIKYTIEGSIELGYHMKENSIEFYVTDTGIGIAKDLQETIFERFVQADLSETRPYEGAGLGLSITKAYVDMLGGAMWIKSEEGKGSTFYFTLPANYKTKNTDDSKPLFKNRTHNKNFLKNITLLIVEDDETAQNYLSELMEDHCKKVIYARTGVEAVELCHKNLEIDLILMDIKMPQMDGYEATRKIRELNTEVIIIAQTAYATPADQEKAINAGCNDYLTKPIKSEDFFAMIHKYVESFKD